MSVNKFSKEFEIHYYEINRYQEATSVSILNFLEETAISHSQSVGLGINNLKSRNLGWILNRWHLNVARYPLYGEKIIIKTWPSGFERFHATREFIIEDSEGRTIGLASSLWFLLNIEKRRPTRIHDDIGNAYGVDPTRAIENPFDDLSSVETTECEKRYTVRRSDIDTNNHVNNVRYIDWILEALPESVSNDFALRSLDVRYKKETSYGSTISSTCICDNDSGLSKNYVHSILDKDTGAELALARTAWIKR